MVITIGREYGSGGKYIGEKLAEKLKCKFYDKELIERVSEENHISLKLLEENDEKQKKSFWYTLAMAACYSNDSINSLTDLPPNEQFFIKTSKTIEEIADKESCIIIGRCSNVILKNREDVVNIFVYASDMDFKINRKIKYGNLSEKQVEKEIKRIDKERAAYYSYFTDGKWGDKNEYDLCIDTSKIGVDKAIDLILEYVKLKQKLSNCQNL